MGQGRAGEGSRKGEGREGMERDKGREGIGEGEEGESEWGSPTHYIRLKSCTALKNVVSDVKFGCL